MAEKVEGYGGLRGDGAHSQRRMFSGFRSQWMMCTSWRIERAFSSCDASEERGAGCEWSISGFRVRENSERATNIFKQIQNTKNALLKCFSEVEKSLCDETTVKTNAN